MRLNVFDTTCLLYKLEVIFLISNIFLKQIRHNVHGVVYDIVISIDFRIKCVLVVTRREKKRNTITTVRFKYEVNLFV